MTQKKLQQELKKQQNEQKQEENHIILCDEHFKSGKNKGKVCCQKVHENSNLCLRHYNLQLKKNLYIM